MFTYSSRVLRPHKGLTHTRPLSCGFDSSVGRALHRYRRGRGFESRSKPEIFFQVFVPVVLRLQAEARICGYAATELHGYEALSGLHLESVATRLRSYTATQLSGLAT